ncbi:MAG: dienelactone hydrolase family protein [Rhizobiales bacterium]|nr:dienelactone hydrolase family protein [Hyphomicrobiales bacterium]
MIHSVPDRLKQPDIAVAGAPVNRAKGVIITLHGRGASAAGILDLADHLAQPDLAFIAPQARGGSWYPYSFLAPFEANQPFLDQALATVSELLEAVSELGFPAQKTGLMGFSQGACLALESAARHAQPLGAVLGFAGGLIGPPGAPRLYSGSLEGAPVLLACSDIDPHIPLGRVEETADVMSRMGALVTKRIYPGFGHGINDDGIAQARRILVAMQGLD